MISFRDYLSTHHKKFVSLNFTKETESKLRQFALDNNFDLTEKFNGDTIAPEDFHFHITVYYTNSYHDIKDREIKFKKPIKLEPLRFDLLGPDKNIPVMIVKISDELKEIRSHFTQQGFKDNFPDYKAHISLSYHRKKYDLNNIKLPSFPILADRLTIQNQ